MGKGICNIAVMRSFALVCSFLATSALAAEWSDSSVKVTTKQMACYADSELYNIMQTGSSFMAECDQSRGDYPTGGQMCKAFCLFDKMKVDWDKVDAAFGSYNQFSHDCKDTNYDTDGGFWDSAGDWFFGEDFDYGSLNTALGNYYNCVAAKLSQEARNQLKLNSFLNAPFKTRRTTFKLIGPR